MRCSDALVSETAPNALCAEGSLRGGLGFSSGLLRDGTDLQSTLWFVPLVWVLGCVGCMQGTKQCAQGDSNGTWISHKIHYRFPCPPDPSHLMYTGGWESMAVGTVLEGHPALQWGVQTTFSPTRLKTETWMCTESLQNSSINFTLFATILGPLPGLVWTTLLFSWITWVAALPKCYVTRAWAFRCAWFVLSTTLDGHKPTHKQILLQYQGLRACKCVCA